MRPYPEYVLGPGASLERMGLFVFPEIFGKGRPPPDAETTNPRRFADGGRAAKWSVSEWPA